MKLSANLTAACMALTDETPALGDVRNEADFQARVMALFRLYGWLAWHSYDSRKSAPGFPDICAVRGKRVLFCELKIDDGTQSPAQLVWAAALAAADGCEFHLWRPADWRRITEILR